jgi:7-cyano-7-deazaguanine synthase
MKRAVVLCSGGLDSVVTANYLKKRLDYKEMIILFFNYGQRAVWQEKKAAKKCALNLNAKFCEIKISEIKNLSHSLINRGGEISWILRGELSNTKKESDKWYVPCRNIIFLSYALSLAESIYLKCKKVFDIAVGFKNEGNDGFPDTSWEFVNKFNEVGEIACKKKFRIIAPLIKKDKEDIVLLGKNMGVKMGDTYSCYVGIKNKNEHCGYCLACRLRQEGFYWANVEDITKYRKKMKDFRRA